LKNFPFFVRLIFLTFHSTKEKTSMKKILLFFILITLHAIGQTLDANNVSARINNYGVQFIINDGGPIIAGYQIPKNLSINRFLATSLWCGGNDSNGNLHLAAMQYGLIGNDFFPGPYSTTNDYNSAIYQSTYGNSIWQVSRTEILDHLANFSSSSHTLPPSIATWPANGVSGIGVAQNLAPFVDMNNNGMYEPLLGDYPDIRGDMAIYTIMNDAKAAHTESGGEIMGIEVHTMAYQFMTNDYQDKTTYLHYRIFNRGVHSYSNFKMGLLWDPDIGSLSDDYVGCDTLQDLMYVYNKDNDDFNNGINPPALGIQSLSKKMMYFSSFPTSLSFPFTIPSTPAEYYNYMNGLWTNGQPKYFGGDGSTGTVTTNYLFSGNPNIPNEWSEYSANNPEGDRRGLMIIEDEALPSGEYSCYDFAVLFAQEPGDNVTNHLTNVDSLISIAAQAKIDYNQSATFNCDVVTLGGNDLEKALFNVYPNPVHDFIHISKNSEFEMTNMEVYDSYGKKFIIPSNWENGIDVSAWSKGVYLIRITSSQGSFIKNIFRL
jgi:Secretion system C-terminal sorting domain